MMRISKLAMLYGLAAVGLGGLTGADRPQAEPGSHPRGPKSAASRPADKANPAGKASTRPAGERPPAGERGRWGWWHQRPEGGGWPGPGGFEGGPQDAGRPGGPHHGGPDEPVLSPQEKEELLAFVRDRFPELYRQLQQFQDTDPGAYGRAVRRLTFPMLHMMRVSKSDPQLAAKMIAEHRVELELADLQSRYPAQASGADREQARSRIRQLVEKRFDLRQQRLEIEIKNMQKRLDQARSHLTQQAADRSQLIDAEVSRTIDHLEKGHHSGSKATPSTEGPPHTCPADPAPGPSGGR